MPLLKRGDRFLGVLRLHTDLLNFPSGRILHELIREPSTCLWMEFHATNGKRPL